MLNSGNGSGGPSLRRRRGTKGRHRKTTLSPSTLWALICVLGLALVGSLTLLWGIFSMLTAEEKTRIKEIVPVLRGGRRRPSPNPVVAPALDGPGRAASASGNNHRPVPPSPPVNGKDGPLQPYPYPLDKLASDEEVASYAAPRGGYRYQEYTSGQSPYEITAAVRAASDTLARSRRVYVQRAMQFAWQGYTKYAFGYDELKPQSAVGENGWGGQGITLVDALDTLWLMGMRDEFYAARDWVRDSLNHGGTTGFTSLFETTIRDLGGLLSAYDLSDDQAFLTKAVDLGDRLLHGFDNTASGIPFGQVNLRTGDAKNIGTYCRMVER